MDEKVQTDLLGSLELQKLMNFTRISENSCIFVALDFLDFGITFEEGQRN